MGFYSSSKSKSRGKLMKFKKIYRMQNIQSFTHNAPLKLGVQLWHNFMMILQSRQKGSL